MAVGDSTTSTETPPSPDTASPAATEQYPGLAEFVQLAKEKRELEAKLKSTKKRLEQLQQPLLDAFTREGTKRINKDGLTVYLRRDLFARAKDSNMAALVSAMKQVVPEFVKETVNAQTLTGYVREEVVKNNRPLDPRLAEVVQVDYVDSLRTNLDD